MEGPLPQPMHWRRLVVMAAILFVISLPGIAHAAVLSAPDSPASPQYRDWPTTEWTASTPEQQGMDSNALAQLLAYIKDRTLHLDSLLIIRHGYVITEAYFYPYTAEFRVNIQSCTKSVASALVGIALRQGKLASLKQPVLDFFPDQTFANDSPLKHSITLEHLLTMSSGLNWPELSSASPQVIADWATSPDYVKYVLDRALLDQPGAQWNYNSGGVHVLSAIIQKITGMKTSAFARQYLFQPIGITSAIWPEDPNGISIGSARLLLTPQDMARFGYLYLNNGVWDDQPIVPAEYVKASTQKHRTAIFNQDYGYLWWIQRSGSYAANGKGGQRIFVVPEQDLVVVMTANLAYPDAWTVPEALLQQWIVPAITSPTAVPENPHAIAQLAARIQEAGRGPVPQPIVALPAITDTIDGRTYQLEHNGYGLTTFGLHFKPITLQEAVLEVNIQGEQQAITLGLDGLYRMNRLAPGSTIAARGSWQTPNRFAVQGLSIEQGEQEGMSMTFRPDGSVSVWIQAGTENFESIEGRPMH